MASLAEQPSVIRQGTVAGVELMVKQLGYREAMLTIVEHHYLHRKCPCSKAYGLYQGPQLVGVIVFGKPASYTLCNGVAGVDESHNVIEFNRLWVADHLGKNTETWFMSAAIKNCGYQILVSFADTEQGHIGYVYQAANWLYCGVSKKQRYFRLKTAGDVGGTLYRRRARMAKSKIIEEYGEEMVEEYFSSKKFRYVLLNVNRHRKKELLSKLKYGILPYPKSSKRDSNA